MADMPLYPDPNRAPGDDAGAGPDGSSTPRWVHVFGIVAIVVVLLFVILHLTGGGLGLHTPP